MKKNLMKSYLSGITEGEHGESFRTILRYLSPEFVTALLLTSLPFWLDAAFIGQLKSTSTYATLGVTKQLIHLLLKAAEAFMVGTVILTGQLNGRKEYPEVGKVVRDAFWSTCFIGISLAAILYLGAGTLYRWYGVSDQMIEIGVPFLRLRACGVLLSFVCSAMIGFLRGIKNTKVPMAVFVLGTIAFIFFDYALIFGKFGFPELGLTGSAYASILEYAIMLSLVMGYIYFAKDNKKYMVSLFGGFEWKYVKHLFSTSWPVILDKATMAWAYIWLCKMFCSLGTCATASFCVVQDMERFAILPAIAGAQVITFLVSNDVGAEKWDNIKVNIKKMVFLCSLLVFCTLILFAMFPKPIISIFDKKGDFTDFAAQAFPIISVLAFFDVLQLILAGALRGSGNVRTVMVVRLLATIFFFIPASYILSHMPIADPVTKFVMVYGSFYLSNAVMSWFYIRRFRSGKWKAPVV